MKEKPVKRKKVKSVSSNTLPKVPLVSIHSSCLNSLLTSSLSNNVVTQKMSIPTTATSYSILASSSSSMSKSGLQSFSTCSKSDILTLSQCKTFPTFGDIITKAENNREQDVSELLKKPLFDENSNHNIILDSTTLDLTSSMEHTTLVSTSRLDPTTLEPTNNMDYTTLNPACSKENITSSLDKSRQNSSLKFEDNVLESDNGDPEENFANAEKQLKT